MLLGDAKKMTRRSSGDQSLRVSAPFNLEAISGSQVKSSFALAMRAMRRPERNGICPMLGRTGGDEFRRHDHVRSTERHMARYGSPR